ncbi:ATP-binding protein [Cryobacterium breve]|uniref:ATP-binding protein n=2 Tax=Microbacteriaceae TaxID=85023 RepID=A0ABY2J672_9MICO|nr:ATP-binding protein [Cryobacterium sp. TmT3-12]TFD00428.1 ATP-binding protein [Cryobacterium breve]
MLLAPVLRVLAGAGATPVVLIDGPSGAGKSTLADALVEAWPGALRPSLVRLDDIYPGWRGLDAAALHLAEHVLAPRALGRPAAWQRYDWARGEPAEWHPVPSARALIVEGCGTLAAAHAAQSDIRVWLGADGRIRKQRALARDGDVFRAHWDQWESDWEAYREREQPERQATVVLLGTSGIRSPGIPPVGLG